MGYRAPLRTWLAGLAVALSTLIGPAHAGGGELTQSEAAALEAGRLVVREENVERGGHRYIGGVSYIVIDAPAERVSAALDDVRTYRQILPNTRSVRWIGLSRKGDALVELEQGNAIAHGKYTVRVRREPGTADSSAATVRFWLDHRYAARSRRRERLLPPRGARRQDAPHVPRDGRSRAGHFRSSLRGQGQKGRSLDARLVKTYVESHRPT